MQDEYSAMVAQMFFHARIIGLSKGYHLNQNSIAMVNMTLADW
jgi:hypothetical protein